MRIQETTMNAMPETIEDITTREDLTTLIDDIGDQIATNGAEAEVQDQYPLAISRYPTSPPP